MTFSIQLFTLYRTHATNLLRNHHQLNSVIITCISSASLRRTSAKKTILRLFCSCHTFLSSFRMRSYLITDIFYAGLFLTKESLSWRPKLLILKCMNINIKYANKKPNKSFLLRETNKWGAGVTEVQWC